ncbi:c-type cytochrome [Candidatus Bathyarchaeota archaeon]|nr:c-type cytochrome [Candidatus Bathyarchaeota archaeon]
MSEDKKKDEGIIDKIEEEIDEIEEEIEEYVHHHNLLPLVGGAFAVFFLMTAMVVAMPYMFYTGTPSTDAVTRTPLEEQGRELYMNLGCFYCHSQFVREIDWGIGNQSQAGDYVYDQPHSLGTERTGPDLSKIGGMRPIQWHYMHDRDPRSTSPGSIMPNFEFLTDQQIDALVAYINSVGTEDLNTYNFQPWPPAEEYINKTNPFKPLMMSVQANYDPETEEFTGDNATAEEWTQLFEQGKETYIKLCLSCHGCSGNGQGPYARHVIERPANLNERISNYPGDFYHFWRVSEGVPGTAMPAWKLSYNESTIWTINTYEMSFVMGSLRTVSGDISDEEGDIFNNATGIMPGITGSQEDYEKGMALFNLYCAQCHGVEGHGDGPASSKTGGYITPEPANFTESGSDFTNYGRYVWKVREGVETTNMPPWKYVLSDEDIFKIIFYIQTFSTPDDFNSKWAPLYTDPFAGELMR